MEKRRIGEKEGTRVSAQGVSEKDVTEFGVRLLLLLLLLICFLRVERANMIVTALWHKNSVRALCHRILLFEHHVRACHGDINSMPRSEQKKEARREEERKKNSVDDAKS